MKTMPSSITMPVLRRTQSQYYDASITLAVLRWQYYDEHNVSITMADVVAIAQLQ